MKKITIVAYVVCVLFTGSASAELVTVSDSPEDGAIATGLLTALSKATGHPQASAIALTGFHCNTEFEMTTIDPTDGCSFLQDQKKTAVIADQAIEIMHALIAARINSTHLVTRTVQGEQLQFSHYEFNTVECRPTAGPQTTPLKITCNLDPNYSTF